MLKPTYLELRPDLGHITHVHSSILNTKHFMDHGLIGPLRQQGCDWVVSSVDYKQYRGGICFSKFKQLIFLCHLIAHFGGKLLGEQAVLLIAYKRLLLE